MGLLNALRSLMTKDDTSGEDVSTDPATAGSRGTGGEEHAGSTDQNSSTGTTPNETFVGRASGDEAEVGESGAERRREAEPDA